MSQICLSVSNFSKTFVISTEMEQIVNKKVIRRRTREIICNTFDYMRITFPFEALTKIGFLRIYFFNLFSENLNLPRHSTVSEQSSAFNHEDGSWASEP
jgi:hypothetical protein